MLRRRFVIPVLLLLAVLGIGGIAYSQLETGDRGILPLDSSGTLEISGIHVDVGGNDAQSARYSGWRIAQRLGFRALWAKMHKAPINQAPNLPDSTLDDIVSSINVETEQIGPNRYIADLGILFDRARAAPFLGVEGGEAGGATSSICTARPIFSSPKSSCIACTPAGPRRLASLPATGPTMRSSVDSP